ncbi:unnamed protein product [Closterium sp. NIES-53]
MPTIEHDDSPSPRPFTAEESASFVDGVDFDACFSLHGLLSRCQRLPSSTPAVEHLRLYRCPASTSTGQRPLPTSHHRYHLRSPFSVAPADDSASSGRHNLHAEGALWASLMMWLISVSSFNDSRTPGIIRHIRL